MKEVEAGRREKAGKVFGRASADRLEAGLTAGPEVSGISIGHALLQAQALRRPEAGPREVSQQVWVKEGLKEALQQAWLWGARERPCTRFRTGEICFQPHLPHS